MNKIVWIKASGQEVTTNDLPANIEAAKALGWKLKKEVEKKDKDQDKDK